MLNKTEITKIYPENSWSFRAFGALFTKYKKKSWE